MLRTLVITSALVAAAGLPAWAEPSATVAATPAASPAPHAARAQRSAAFALRGAYHAIAQAQALGATTYLEAAKSHYRDAIDRYGRSAAGAADQARAASALALASIAEHALPAPRDIPAPPTLPQGMAGGPRWAGPPPPGSRPPLEGRRPPAMADRGPGGGPPPPGAWPGPPGRPGFDAAETARAAKIAATAEASSLAQKALDADLAATRAAFAGNAEDAQRQRRVAGALAEAVRAIAQADHPTAFPQPPRWGPRDAAHGPAHARPMVGAAPDGG